MSIEQADVVDAIGIDTVTDEVVLTVTDHLDWLDLENHIFLIQEKLNAYLSFVESGEISESYPKANGRKIRVDLIGKYEIVREAEPYIEQMREVMKGAGVALRTRLHRPDSQERPGL